MATREETMRALGVLECPSWCTQDETTEAQFQQHIGEWADILTNAGADGGVTVRARPRRNWANADGVEGDGEGFTEIEYLCDGDDCPEWFRNAEVQTLTEGLTEVDDEANRPREWVWAYAGADQDAAMVDAAAV